MEETNRRSTEASGRIRSDNLFPSPLARHIALRNPFHKRGVGPADIDNAIFVGQTSPSGKRDLLELRHRLRHFQAHKSRHEGCKVNLAGDGFDPGQRSGQRRDGRHVAISDRGKSDEAEVGEDAPIDRAAARRCWCD